MDEIDDLTRGKLREWQVRRLEIKDRMQSQPEKTLELSRVLDLMDDEHATILAGAKRKKVAPVPEPSTPVQRLASAVHCPRPNAGALSLQLNVTADNAADLNKLLEMAIHELRGKLDAAEKDGAREYRTLPGEMSGSLGGYHFELGFDDEGRNE